MRVLQVVTQGGIGGAQVQVLAIARALIASGHEASIAIGATGQLTQALDRERIPWTLLPSLGQTNNPFALLRARAELRTFAETIAPDTTIAHSTHAIALLNALPRGKRVAVIHGWSLASEGAPWLTRGIARMAYRFLLRSADVIVCVCGADRTYGNIHCLIPSKATVIVTPNGLPGTLDILPRTEARQALGIAPETFAVGAVARLAQQKRLDRLFNATHDPAWPTHARAIVLGQGPLAESLAGQTPAHGTLRTDLAHPAQYLSAFDAFALTSDYEGLPYAVLEAGAAALPVIATDVGGLRELLDDGRAGVLVPRGDVHAFALAVAALTQNPAQSIDLGMTLRERIRTHYQEAEMTAAILKVLV